MVIETHIYGWRSPKRLVGMWLLKWLMRESIKEDQDKFIMRKSEHEELGLESNNNKAALEDVGQNADLYILPIKRTTHTHN